MLYLQDLVRKKKNGFRLSKLDFKLLEDVTGVEDRSYEISLQQIHYKISWTVQLTEWTVQLTEWSSSPPSTKVNNKL